MSKQIVAVDLHDTIFSYTTTCIEKYGWPANPLAKTLREIWLNVDWDVHFSQPHHSQFLSGLRPLGGALDCLDQLILSEQYEVIITTATAKGGADEAATRETLAEWGLDQVAIQFLSGHDNKAEWLVDPSNKVSFLIDDYGPLIESVARRQGPRCLVIDGPWNRYLRVGRRFLHWAELQKFFFHE